MIPVSGKGSGRVSIAGLTCYQPGRRSRFLYRTIVHRRRKGERRSFSERDYINVVPFENSVSATQPSGGDLHQEQHVVAGQADRVHVQEVASQQPFGLGAQELCPGRGPPLRGAGSTPAFVKIVHTVLEATR